MPFENYLQNPAGLAIGVFLIIFATSFYLLSKRIDKGASLIISLALSFLSAWNLYARRFYGWESAIRTIFFIVVLVLIIKLTWSLLKLPFSTYKHGQDKLKGYST